MTEKIPFLLLIFLFIPLNTKAQTSYYARDTLVYFGVKIEDKGALNNSRACHLKVKGELVILSPEEITEYGTDDGKRYISKEITINGEVQNVFLERISEGDLNLYFFRGEKNKSFFIEKGSSFITELPKKDARTGNVQFKNQLELITSDCDELSGTINNVRYNKAYLKEYVNSYNNCQETSFRSLSFGFRLGFIMQKVSSPSANSNYALENINYKFDLSLSASLFIDYPIFASDFSLLGEFGITKYSLSNSGDAGRRSYELVVDITRLDLPLILKYTRPEGCSISYLLCGTQLGFNLSNESSVYEVITPDGIVSYPDLQMIKLNDGNLISKFQSGLIIGVGTDRPLVNDISTFIEGRFNLLFSKSGSQSLNNSFLQLSTGIYF